MKSKRTGKELPFIKIKGDDPKQAEAQKTGIIFKVKEFKTTPSILQCFKCQGFGRKTPNCTKNQKCVVCVVKLIHTKTVKIWKKEIQNVQLVGDLMLPIIKAVLHTRTKLLSST